MSACMPTSFDSIYVFNHRTDLPPLPPDRLRCAKLNCRDYRDNVPKCFSHSITEKAEGFKKSEGRPMNNTEGGVEGGM